MKFGPISVDDAEGAILAHSTQAGARRLRKAHQLTAEDIATLKQAGIASIVAAVPAQDDLSEDDAATAIASSCITEGIERRPAATGRVNLHATEPGIFVVDRALVDAINAIDPAITLATLPEFARVERGQMVATVKIIPYAVASTLVDRACALAGTRIFLGVKPFASHKVGLLQTTLPSLKPTILDKTVKVTEQRLSRSGSMIVCERRVTHDAEAVADALRTLEEASDIVLLFGASAVSDPDDVIPAAIRQAGGEVIRTGMPVDPGNLIVVGRLNRKPVLGAPGCARSPKENGFDWVLDRLLAGLDVTSADIAGMGVGGLLMEIPTRPQPREPVSLSRTPRVEAIILAAGRSSRMGGPNKLLALFEGTPLVRLTAQRALASRVSGAVIVAGHQTGRIEDAVAGLHVVVTDNPDFASGLASSLKAGIAALSSEADGALIMLGDMPGVTTGDLDRLIDAFAASGGKTIVRACHAGKRGNPVILPRPVFAEIATLEGDTGARHIIESGTYPVVDVEIGAGASVDVDTPEAMALAGGVLQG